MNKVTVKVGLTDGSVICSEITEFSNDELNKLTNFYLTSVDGYIHYFNTKHIQFISILKQ